MMKKSVLRILTLAAALVMLMTSCGLAEVLRPGSSGDAVKRLQQALTQLGYYSGPIDGKYGTGTTGAVEDFQAAAGLTADGKAGSATQAKIKLLTGIDVSDDVVTPAPGATTPSTAKGLFKGDYHKLVFGARGTRVRVLQQALIDLGFNVSKADGVFGTSTYAAVKNFQATVGLEADGKAGEKTLKKLESYFDANGKPTTGPIVTQPPAADDENLVYGIPQRTLREGMSGLDVQYTQDRLKELGYYTGKSDGQYGSGTVAAVKAFQRNNGLTVDGKLGSKSSQVLFSTGALGSEEQGDNPTTHRKLKLGMEGDDVAAMQARLAQLGYYAGTVDGKFGESTLSALRWFQQRNDLTVDGVCGEDTTKVLYSGEAVDAGSTVQPEPEAFPTGAPTRTLRPGDDGDEVKSVQLRLQTLGYYTGKIDGKYGSGTMAAVRLFQTRNGLNADGKVGSKTSGKLYSPSAIPAGSGETPTPTPTATPQVTPSRTLQLGDEGNDVVMLQIRLIELGYLTGKADGKFGSGTGAAVAAFQLRNGLSADGIAGKKTYKKLFSTDAVQAPTVGETTPPPATQSRPGRALYDGCAGDDVKLVQQRLADLGYLQDAVDGQYGSKTAAAVRAFQAMNGLTVSGMTEDDDYDVLFSVNAITASGMQLGGAAPETGYTNLTIGSTGTAVLRLQQMLSTLKYSVSVNGTYDETTYAAVLAFQKRNGLTADGIAGKATQTKLYSGNCVTGDTVLPGEDSSSSGSTGNGGGPAVSQVKLLMWYDEIKPTIKSGQTMLVYEPVSNSSFYLRIYSRGRHCDSEPLTAADTAIMKAAWGGKFSWAEKPVYVRLPNGTWCLASMHSMPHEENGLKNNDFEGHLCVHFPRTMEETISSGDTKNGVRHQKDIRKHWLQITGEEITW